MLEIAALLLVCIAFAHSFLGERYILMRLFRRDTLPKLFGNTSFTERTLRFAWHLTSVAWLGLAAILWLAARPDFRAQTVIAIVGGTFLIHGAVALFASRGKHLSWVVFLAVAALAFYAAFA